MNNPNLQHWGGKKLRGRGKLDLLRGVRALKIPQRREALKLKVSEERRQGWLWSGGVYVGKEESGRMSPHGTYAGRELEIRNCLLQRDCWGEKGKQKWQALGFACQTGD